MDDLIARLRARVADPERRNDAPQSVSMAGPGGTLTSMFGNTAALRGVTLGSLMDDLRRVVVRGWSGSNICAMVFTSQLLAATLRVVDSFSNGPCVLPFLFGKCWRSS